MTKIEILINKCSEKGNETENKHTIYISVSGLRRDRRTMKRTGRHVTAASNWYHFRISTQTRLRNAQTRAEWQSSRQRKRTLKQTVQALPDCDYLTCSALTCISLIIYSQVV